MIKYQIKDVYIYKISVVESFWLLSGDRFKKMKNDFFQGFVFFVYLYIIKYNKNLIFYFNFIKIFKIYLGIGNGGGR